MADRKTFHDSVTPLNAQTGLTPQGLLVQATKPEQRSEKMKLLFSLALPAAAQATLEEKVAKGETVSPDELKRYAPKKADVDALVGWLKQQSYSDVAVSKDGSGVYASAPVSQIEQTLQVQMVRVTKGGLTYTAARNAPSLPSDVGEPVVAIVGLQPFRQAHKHSLIRAPRGGNRTTLAGAKADRAAATTNIENAPPYLVPEILKAYNADGLAVTGAAQTIGILIDTMPADSDVRAFWSRNAVAGAPDRVVPVNVTGASLPAPSGEETLDVSWSSSIAPGAKIKVYATGSLSFVDLDQGLDGILADASADPTLRQVSISLGLGETYFGGSSGEVATQHQKFLKLAALGVNVFVSSGDAGSNPDQTGHGSAGPLQVEYESSDPCVIGVGGTTLELAATGQVADETGWSSGGGGKSKYFPRPSWQKAAGVPHGKTRLVPDVGLTADPDHGAFLVLNGKPIQIGGTSWSAPVWAGFCALINEARSAAGKPSLPFLNPLIYPLAGGACFRDVTAGTNGAYDAGPGFDLVTGLGVPNVAQLIAALTR